MDRAPFVVQSIIIDSVIAQWDLQGSLKTSVTKNKNTLDQFVNPGEFTRSNIQAFQGARRSNRCEDEKKLSWHHRSTVNRFASTYSSSQIYSTIDPRTSVRNLWAADSISSVQKRVATVVEAFLPYRPSALAANDCCWRHLKEFDVWHEWKTSFVGIWTVVGWITESDWNFSRTVYSWRPIDRHEHCSRRLAVYRCWNVWDQWLAVKYRLASDCSLVIETEFERRLRLRSFLCDFQSLERKESSVEHDGRCSSLTNPLDWR